LFWTVAVLREKELIKVFLSLSLLAGNKTELVGFCYTFINALLFAAFKGTLPRKWCPIVNNSPSRVGRGQT